MANTSNETVTASSPVWTRPTRAPSGLELAAPEVIYEPKGVRSESAKTVRLRYVAPELGDSLRFGFDAVEQDFSYLCETHALPLVAKSAPQAELVIISMAAEAISLGESAPDVVQFFEAFQIVNGKCIWEGV
ncbi:MAG: hypothetical protein JXR14_09405 [Paracoccaceae bacterium]